MLPHKSTVLSLEEYLTLVRGLPLPTTEQRKDFVDYVANSHSWYKHLPAFLPGADFYFYLDKAAGCDWLTLPDGSHAIAERRKRGFHYSAIPTAEYRARFGFLSYSCAGGTAVFLSGEPLAFPRDKIVAVPDENAKPRALPQPIQEAGRAVLTGIIHPRFAEMPWWTWRIPAQRSPWWAKLIPHGRRVSYWPAESGGRRTHNRILQRIAYLRHQPESQQWSSDPVLNELMMPERSRQLTDMLDAIDRVCMLIEQAQKAGTRLN